MGDLVNKKTPKMQRWRTKLKKNLLGPSLKVRKIFNTIHHFFSFSLGILVNVASVSHKLLEIICIIYRNKIEGIIISLQETCFCFIPPLSSKAKIEKQKKNFKHVVYASFFLIMYTKQNSWSIFMEFCFLK